jgi:hypothetical protein
MARPVRLLLAAVLVVSAVACGGDERGLPPEDEAALARTVQPYLEPLGLEFSYGGLEDFPAGKHLALYVEPVGPTTDAQYLERLVASTATLAPVLFDTYPDLNSFDICQEPVPTGPDDPDRPKPRTVVVLGRRQASTVGEWSAATLADLIAAARVGRGGAVTVDDAIAQLPAYIEAVAEADRIEPPGEDDGGY